MHVPEEEVVLENLPVIDEQEEYVAEEMVPDNPIEEADENISDDEPEFEDDGVDLLINMDSDAEVFDEEEESDGDIEVWSDQSDTEGITILEHQVESDTGDEAEDTVVVEPDELEASDPESSASEFVTPVESPTHLDIEHENYDPDSLDEEESVDERPPMVGRSKYGRVRRGAEHFGYDKKGGNPKISRYSSAILMKVNNS